MKTLREKLGSAALLPLDPLQQTPLQHGDGSGHIHTAGPELVLDLRLLYLPDNAGADEDRGLGDDVAVAVEGEGEDGLNGFGGRDAHNEMCLDTRIQRCDVGSIVEEVSSLCLCKSGEKANLLTQPVVSFHFSRLSGQVFLSKTITFSEK